VREGERGGTLVLEHTYHLKYTPFTLFLNRAYILCGHSKDNRFDMNSSKTESSKEN
jgi:hypothetical protein